MTSDVPAHFADADYRVSLGKVVRQLRLRRGWTLDQFAAASGLKKARLGQIERGAAFSGDELLARVASALGVGTPEILNLADEIFQQRVELQDLLEHLLIPRANWDEFLALEFEARGALIEVLHAQLPARAGIRKQVEEIADAIERDGLEASIDQLVDGISRRGLPPLDYLRNSVQLEEMPGERLIFADRLSLSPAKVPIDELFLFRASYGIEPSNPKLLKWWSETRRSAVVANLASYGSRSIIPLESLTRYITTGERGPHIVLPPDVVLAHLVAIIELLRTNANFKIGLADRQLPVTYRIKGDRHVIVSLSGYILGPNPQKSNMTLRFSRVSVADQFRRHFETTWQGIAECRKDSAAVADWLERQLPNVAQRS